MAQIRGRRLVALFLATVILCGLFPVTSLADASSNGATVFAEESASPGIGEVALQTPTPSVVAEETPAAAETATPTPTNNPTNTPATEISSGIIVAFLDKTGEGNPLSSLSIQAGEDASALSLPHKLEVKLKSVEDNYSLTIKKWIPMEGSEAVGIGQGPWLLTPVWDDSAFPLSDELEKKVSGDTSVSPVIQPDPYAIPYVVVTLAAEEIGQPTEEAPALRGSGIVLYGAADPGTVTFTGTENGLCTPAVLFDAMAGVSAASDTIGALAVKITSITSSDSSYHYVSGDTSFTPGTQTVPPKTYTITYAAYDPTDASETVLKTATRTLTAFQAAEYHPGKLVVTSTSGADPNSTTYRITDAVTSSMFTVRYTVPTGYTTNKTVLVVDTLKYGTQWASNLDGSTNPNITQVVRLSDTTYAILLADGLTGDVTIDFTLKYKALTQAQCIEWMDNGTLPASNLTAREYYMPIGTLSNVLTDPTIILQPNEANYFSTDIRPENTTSQTVTATHTYNMTVSSVAALTNQMMSELGAGRAGSNDSYLYSNSPDPNLMYSIPTVHTSGTPLMEMSGIKVYVPDARLKLTGVSNTPNGRQTDNVYDADYYQIWNNWVVGARQTDAGGDYYVITPPAGTRLFNNGTDLKTGNLMYGMRLLWALVDNAQELGYSTTAYTPYQAPNTGFEYQIPNATAPLDQTLSHTGPKVTTWIRKIATATQAYNPVRHKDNIPNNNIIIGSYQPNQLATYLSNTWYKTTTSGTVTEFVPISTGAATQTYTFPYEIQPENVTLTDLNQKNTLDGRKTVLGSATYTTADGVTHQATAAEVAAVNAYYNGTSATPGTISFSAASASNRVTGLTVNWTTLATLYGINYPTTADGPVQNIVTGTWYRTSGSLATVVTNFTYRVTTTHEDGTPIINYEMAQANYSVDFADPQNTDFASAPNYLWWRFKVPPCPTVNSEQVTANNYGTSYYADGTSQYASGNLYFYIGNYGERIDDLVNPTVDFFTKFNDKGRLSGVNNLTGMTEAEGIAFLSGAFTAMPKLSGWVFTYSTNQRSGVTWTVPTITATAGQAVQIPLNSGEYFTSLSMTYPGTLSTAHASETDTNTTIYLMKNIMMTALNTNPNTGAALNTTSPYAATFVQLHGYAYWDNCNEEGFQHTHTATNPGQQVIFPVSSTLIYPPETGIYFTRQARLSETTTVVMPTNIASIYQGSGTSGSFRFTMQAYPYPTNSNATTVGQYNPFDSSSKFPWQNIREAVYVELKDPEFMPNLAACSLYGVPVSSGNVSATTVTVAGKTYIKLQFVDGYQRTQSLRYPYTGAYFANFSNNFFNSNADYSNAAGIVDIAFTTLPGTTTGRHYPIGDVYLDFTELLNKYDAPNVATGYDLNRTNWLIAGNADLPALAGGQKPDTNQLFKYSFASGTSSAYAVDVIKAQSVGATIVPGKNSVEYDVSDRVTDFWGDERTNLNALMSITGSLTNNIYDMNSYITIPRAGTNVPYVDGSGASHSNTSNLSLYLKNAPVILGDTTGLANNIHFSYTTDATPSATSSYSSTAPTTPEGWRAVTGIKVTVDTLTAESAVNLRLDLSADAKTSIGELTAYSAGTFQYKSSPADTEYATGNLPLISWVYKDYTVNQPSGVVFWDTYDENGIKSSNAGQGESYVAGVTLELLDVDGTTVIDTAVTDANGQFSLKSYKSDAGQSIRITMPTNAGTTVKLTKQSTAGITASLTDSDFNRQTNLLALPKLTQNGLANISAGLVKLPKIVIADQTFVLGQTPTAYNGTLTEYLGMNLPASPVYRLQYDTPADTSIASFSPYIAPNATSKVTPSINHVGTTTARVWVTNILGDVVEATYRITVTTTYSNIPVTKNWDDNANALGTRPSSVTLQLQRSINGGEMQNVGSPVSVTSPWTYTFSHMPDYDVDGNKYTYSVVELNTDKNYVASSTTDSVGNPVVTNTLQLITVSGAKTWSELGAGFTRPSQITIHLYRDGVAMTPAATYTKVVTAADADPANSNTWLYSFSGLLGYHPLTGEAYVYTVQEDTLPAGSNYTGESHGMDLTNMYPAKTYFTVEKTWDHGALPEALRPDSVKISLYRDGALFTGELTTKLGATPGTVELNGSEATPWTYTFEVARADSEGHVFSVVETGIAGYTTTVGAMVIDPADPYHVSCEVTNRYTPTPVDYTVGLNKAITGDLPADADAKEFDFTLTSLASGQPMPNGATTMSVSNSVNGAGAVSFGSIRFSKAGVYTYSIQEVDHSADAQYRGYTFDKTIYTLKVTVEDLLGNGILTANATLYKPDDTRVEAPWTIENEYQALPAVYTLGVNKLLSGDPAVLPETFHFSLTGSGAAPLPAGSGNTASIAGEGYAAFGQITFEQAGKYTYTIQEVMPSVADRVEGYTYSTQTVTVTITVTDVNGQLTATADVANDDIVITNAFAMPTISVSGEKIWQGDFGDGYPTARINLWKNHPAPIEGDLPYATYDIVEGGTTYSFAGLPKYDESGKPIVYTVTETPIEGIYTRQEGNNFTNTVITPATASVHAQKLLDGAAPAGSAYAFHLEQTGYLDDNGIAQAFSAYSDNATNTGKDIVFGDITYTKSGTYTYRITEVAGDDAGIIYDDRAYDATVVVALNTETAALFVDSIVYRLEDATEDSETATFENFAYKPITPTEADPPVQKVVTGDARILESDFTFVMTAQNASTPMPDHAMGGTKTLILTGNDSGEFGAITYSAPGLYVYTISETNTAVAGYTYDTAVYTLTVKITSDAQGNLSAERTLNKAGEPTEAVVFTNAFVQPKGTLTIRKIVTGEGAPAADTFTFIVTFSNGGTYSYTGSSTGSITSGGSITLKHDEQIEIAGLPVGVTYTVVEEAKTNYTPSPSSRMISGAIAGTPSTAEFVNAYLNTSRFGNLTVSKMVTGDLSNTSTNFTFYLTLDVAGSFVYRKGTQSGTISSGGSFTLHHGEAITIYALPEGTAYAVREVNAAPYKVTSTGATGNISTLNNHAVFLNTRSSVPKTGDEQNNVPLMILLAISLVGFAGSTFVMTRLRNKRKRHV